MGHSFRANEIFSVQLRAIRNIAGLGFREDCKVLKNWTLTLRGKFVSRYLLYLNKTNTLTYKKRKYTIIKLGTFITFTCPTPEFLKAVMLSLIIHLNFITLAAEVRNRNLNSFRQYQKYLTYIWYFTLYDTLLCRLV